MSNVTGSRATKTAALGAGLTLAVSVGLFAYGGLWLDERFGTKPWLLLACVAFGIVGGILHLIRVLAPESWPFGRLPRKQGTDGSSAADPQRGGGGGTGGDATR